MKVSVDKWGNSLGIRIPSSIAKQSQLKKGSTVHIELIGDQIVMTTEPLTLDTLLAKVTEANKHHEAFDGSTSGNEEW